jgi:hypothetical protein
VTLTRLVFFAKKTNFGALVSQRSPRLFFVVFVAAARSTGRPDGRLRVKRGRENEPPPMCTAVRFRGLISREVGLLRRPTGRIGFVVFVAVSSLCS